MTFLIARGAQVLAVGLVSAVLLAGCASGGTDDAGSSEPPPTTSAPAQASTTAPTVTSSTEPAPDETAEESDGGGSGGSSSWTMPDESGMDLQDAQNDIQHLTSYGIAITRSHDASGDGRHQILDHDWKVCSQNIDAGETITPDSDIVFEVVKQDETCP